MRLSGTTHACPTRFLGRLERLKRDCRTAHGARMGSKWELIQRPDAKQRSTDITGSYYDWGG